MKVSCSCLLSKEDLLQEDQLKPQPFQGLSPLSSQGHILSGQTLPMTEHGADSRAHHFRSSRLSSMGDLCTGTPWWAGRDFLRDALSHLVLPNLSSVPSFYKCETSTMVRSLSLPTCALPFFLFPLRNYLQ